MAHTKVTKTGTQNTGTANTFSYSGSFDVFKASEVQVTLDNIVLTLTTSTINESASPREYTVDYSNKTVHIGGADLASSNTVVIQPVTDMGAPTPRATYEPGASVTSDDLNNNQLQLMRKAMEYNEQMLSSLGGTMTGNLHLGQNIDITFEGDNDNAHEITLTVADPTSDKTITFPDTTGTVVTTGDTGTVTATMLAANSVDSSELVDGSIDTSHIADSQVTAAKLGSSAVTTAKLATDAVTTAKITDANVTTAKIAADAITGAKIADDAIDSEHYTDGSIDTAHIADLNVTTAKIAADAVTNAKIADDSIDSEHYVDGSIDTAHIAGAQVTDAKLASNSVTTSKITDANITTVKIADNAITIGKIGCEQTTISDSDSHIPTSGAVVDYVAAQIAPIGGLEVIADEDNFPTSQPGAGVVISISDAAGIVVNGSGVSTTARTAGNGSDNVTINNFPSSLYSETLASGVGLMVSSTGSSNTYNYHKLLAAETDVKQLSDDINDFNARYRVGSSNPSSALDSGDLFFNTGTGKLLVYNGTNSAWEEAQSIGQYFINTISSYSGTGGNSASFNGSAYRFVLSNPGSTAEQHIVSVNGVIQKPNSGTSQPSEGFAIDGSSIIFSAAPASSADFFIITIGSTVNIGTPSNGTVTADKLTSGAVTTAKIADGAVTTAKVADDAVTAAKLASSAVVTASIVDANVTTAKIADDAVTAAKIADDAINSEHYTDGSIDTAHIADLNVTTAKIAADAITGAKIADDAIDSEHYAAGSIDLEHMSSESVDEDNLHISNAGSDGQFLQKQSGNTGGLTWASVSSTPEGTAILSTGESGGSKFLREDGDGTCSWQTVGSFVTGMIILWSGATNAIPSGWVICDGQNSTPDLRNRFVVGAGDSYAVGATGGATTDSITVSVSGTTGGPSASGYALPNAAGTNASSGHTHSFSGSGSATVDTLPPYYALCYIMKT